MRLNPIIHEMMNNSKQKQRAGKWTAAENSYAEALVKAFHSGQLDIEEGISLRKLLADKLCCSVKRVSKKYEGTDYQGKVQYVKNPHVKQDEIYSTKAQLKRLEQAFLDSVAELEALAATERDISLSAAAASEPTSSSRVLPTASAGPLSSSDLAMLSMMEQSRSQLLDQRQYNFSALHGAGVSSSRAGIRPDNMVSQLVARQASVDPLVALSGAFGGGTTSYNNNNNIDWALFPGMGTFSASQMNFTNSRPTNNMLAGRSPLQAGSRHGGVDSLQGISPALLPTLGTSNLDQLRAQLLEESITGNRFSSQSMMPTSSTQQLEDQALSQQRRNMLQHERMLYYTMSSNDRSALLGGVNQSAVSDTTLSPAWRNLLLQSQMTNSHPASNFGGEYVASTAAPPHNFGSTQSGHTPAPAADRKREHRTGNELDEQRYTDSKRARQF